MHKGWTGLTASDRLLHAGAFNWSYTLGTGLLDPWSVGATALVLSDETDISAWRVGHKTLGSLASEVADLIDPIPDEAPEGQ